MSRVDYNEIEERAAERTRAQYMPLVDEIKQRIERESWQCAAKEADRHSMLLAAIRGLAAAYKRAVLPDATCGCDKPRVRFEWRTAEGTRWPHRFEGRFRCVNCDHALPLTTDTPGVSDDAVASRHDDAGTK